MMSFTKLFELVIHKYFNNLANTDRLEIGLFKEEALPPLSWCNKSCFLPLMNLICKNGQIEFE